MNNLNFINYSNNVSESIHQCLLRARPHDQNGTQICDPLANKCPEGHDSLSKSWELYLARGHLFDSEGHLFEMEGHLFDREGIFLTGRGIYFEKGHNFVTNY